jgi:transposase
MARRLSLLPAPAELTLLSVAPTADAVTIHVQTRRPQVPCPERGCVTARVHSRYTRTLADLPWQGCTVTIRVQTRRFFCPEATCPRRIFAERLTETTARYARRTLRFSTALDAIGLALGGEPGARLAGRLSMDVSADTLLRQLLRTVSGMPAAVPRVLGVDDWAYRRGQRYGTMLVDLETRRPVDLLPDRTAESLAEWLRRYPGTEIVARDRSTEYSRAIRLAAPHVREVADRWHLLHNLRQVIERFFSAIYARLKQDFGAEVMQIAPDSSWSPQRRSPAERASPEAARQQRQRCYEEVHRLHREEGRNLTQIARHLEISRVTVRKYLASDVFPERSLHPPVARILQPYEAHLEARWRQGCHNARQLWREIRALGYTGATKQVHRWAHPRRAEPAKNTPHKHRRFTPMAPEKRQNRFPAPRRLAWLLMRDPEALSASEAAVLKCIRADPEVERAYDLARRFARMIQRQQADVLDPWLAACAESEIPILVTFGQGLQRDYAAVSASLELPWSSGQAEGQINRLKTLKRQMYGRAGFDLLRARVLRAA